MSRKNVLAPQKISSAVSLSSSFNSNPTMIDFMDNCGYQINVTTTNSQGTFAVQGSLDYYPGDANKKANAGNWASLSLGGGTPTVSAANDTIIIKLDLLPYRAIRLVYTSSVAGTGVADIWIMNKAVGS